LFQKSFIAEHLQKPVVNKNWEAEQLNLISVSNLDDT
jgi:hypothetical protein